MSRLVLTGVVREALHRSKETLASKGYGQLDRRGESLVALRAPGSQVEKVLGR